MGIQNRKLVEDININYEHRFIDFVPIESKSIIRIAFYDVKRVLVYEQHISVYYKKKSVMTMKGELDEIRKKCREFNMTPLPLVHKA